MKRFDTEITIPITIHYETVSADGYGWNNPHVSAHINISEIEVYDEKFQISLLIRELSDYIMRNWPDKLLEECHRNEDG